jgi:hypothetical protein
MIVDMVHCAPFERSVFAASNIFTSNHLTSKPFGSNARRPGEDGSMVSQPKSVNAQVAECDQLLTGCRVIDPATGLNDVAEVAISGGTVVALGGPAPRGAWTI